ncbi:MAG TPA: ABC transporter ATP-binding protein [Streptosporangiaceae bacterium]
MLEVDVEVDRPEFTVRADLQIAAGERLALFGPSGAGKTTLLEVIAGLTKPRRAVIMLGGKLLTSTDSPVIGLPPWRRGVGLLRQDPGLFPHLSVRDNLRYSRSVTGDSDELGRLAKTLGIDGLLGKMPARLSGGQAHRVALGRLLLSRCDALLLDEPYTGLDVSLRRTLTDLVITLVAERNVPAILVAHELAEAQAFADRMAVLERGSLLQLGDPGEIVQRPASCRVAELVGYPAFVPAGDGTVAGIHPDRIVGGSHPALGLVIEGTVTGCRPAGALFEIDLRTASTGQPGGEEIVTARLPGPASVGQPLVITATDPPLFWPGGAAIEAESSRAERE